jgi:hypothetical protein
MTAKIAWHLERQALRKIANDPVIRQLAEEIGLHPAATEETSRR